MIWPDLAATSRAPAHLPCRPLINLSTLPDTDFPMSRHGHPPVTAFSPTRRFLLAGAAALPLAGCFRTGSASAPDEAQLVHVATPRNAIDGGRVPPFFGNARAGRVTYAKVQLGGPESVLGSVVGGTEVRRVDIQAGDAGEQIAQALRGRDSLLYVHGYNNTFESAMAEVAQLVPGTGFAGNAVLFSWVSKGGLLDYNHDRESALIARDQLADVLASILNDPFGAKVHIVAHSMGTLVTLEALRSYRDRHGEQGFDRIGAVVFASPDIDIDVFRANLGRLGSLRAKMTVITATNDRALDVSRRLAGGARLGALPAKDLDGLGIRVVDATEFAGGLVRHDAFLSNADVRGVIRRAIERA
jgi:esterase/lipase superfamily enzyme